MATLNVDGAINTVTSQTFLVSVVAIAVGSLGAQLWTDWARANLVDIGVQGGDALYALLGGLVLLALPLPRKYSRPAAMGMGATGALTAARDFNVV